MFSILNEIGNQAQAIEWAKDLELKFNGENFADHNPCTKVYQLVLELLGKSELLNAELVEKLKNGE